MGRPPAKIAGKRFGRWTAIEYNGNKQWLCRCDCGTVRPVFTGTLTSGQSQSCGCLRDELSSRRASAQHLDIAGERFGRWTAVEYLGKGRWRCICECGTEGIRETRVLRYGDSQSCGCLQRERLLAANFTHRLSGHPLYGAWHHMLNRCRNPNDPGFRHYGGRGITVCGRWQGPDGFPNFLADMGEKPTPEHTLDRIDNDGPYSPENCRWATKSEQNTNKRRLPISAEGRARISAGRTAKKEARNAMLREEFLTGGTTRHLAAKHGLSLQVVQKAVKGLPRDRSHSPEHVAKRWSSRRAKAAAQARST